MTPSSRTRAAQVRAFLIRAVGVLALVVGSAAVALLVMEGVVRTVAPQQLIELRPELWQGADSVGHLHRPNVAVRTNTGERTVTVYTDKDGFRVGAAGRREAPTQVLLIGDSFMEAIQVEHEQSTAYLLEKALEGRLQQPIAVRNAGISDWNPNQYLVRSRALMATDRYALLVVSIFVGNDAVKRVAYVPARAPFERKRFHLPHGFSAAALIDGFFSPLNDALETRSQLFVLMKSRLSVLRMKLGLTAEYFPVEYRRSEANSPRWKSTAAIAVDIRDAAAAHGVPTVFVLVPEAFQVYSRDFDDYVRGFGVDPNTVDLAQPSRRLEEELVSAGLTVVQTLDAFRAAADTSERLFGLVDHHLTPAGHVLLTQLLAPHAADAIARW